MVGLKLRLEERGTPLRREHATAKRRKSSGDVRIFRAAGANRRTGNELEPLVDNGQHHLA